MAENIKNILSHLSTDIDQETLLQYLKGQLSEEKKHELEKELLDNEFASDAVEGLQQMKDQRQVDHMVEMLNRDLKKKTARKRLRRRQLELKDNSWLYISILILVLLIVLSYFIIHRHLQASGRA